MIPVVMKILRHIAAAALSLIGCNAFAQQTPLSQAQAAVFENQFYAIFADLMPHKDIVNAAGLALQAEGYRPASLSGFFQTLGRKARANYQLSLQGAIVAAPVDAASFTDRENASRKEAHRLYPDVANPNSLLYKRIGEERQTLTRICPSYFQNPNWPLMLTNQCIGLMSLEAQEKQGLQAWQAQQPPSGQPYDPADDLVKWLRDFREMQNLLKNRR